MNRLAARYRRNMAELERTHMRRVLTLLEEGQGPVVVLHGKPYLNAASNDYLGLTRHPALRDAAKAALDRYGCGSGASRLISGTSPEHEALERELADFFGREDAIIFNSGYHANVGILSSLPERGDVLFSDELCHASIIDGCRLSKAEVRVFRHADAFDLERLLTQAEKEKHLGTESGEDRATFVVTDSVFSMDGDAAPLALLDETARRHDAGLIVDEAHGVGVFGEFGRGMCEEAGIKPFLQVGTFSKAAGSMGAYAAGDGDVCLWLRNKARSFIFSTALPPSVLAANRAALRVFQSAEGRELREKLSRMSRTVRKTLVSQGWELPADGDSPILYLLCGQATAALACAETLQDGGVFAKAIRPPTVAAGTCRVRLSLRADFTDDHVNTLLTACEQARSRLDLSGFGENKG